MKQHIKQRIFSTLLTSLLIFLFTFPAFGGGGRFDDDHRDKGHHGKARSGAVFVMTNAADGNEIIMYRRSASGRLSFMDRFPTGGLGSGVGKTVDIDPLGSQNSLIMDEKGKYLYAVNAGDDTITVFQVRKGYLKFLDNVPSGGRYPVSLTVHRKILYVLNAGANDGSGNETPANITGFRMKGYRLFPLEGSTRELIDVPQNPTDPTSDFPNIFATPAQIQFSPWAKLLVVTIKDAVNGQNNAIWVFEVDKENDYLTADTPLVYQTDGPAPFGFTLDSFGRFLVTDAGNNTVTSYVVQADEVTMIDSVETGQAATCWIIGTGPFVRYVYAANTGSGTLSGYRVHFDGTLSEVGRFPVKEGASLNIDMGISRDGRYIYTQNGGLGTVSIFRVKRNGTLAFVDEVKVTEPVSGFQGLAVW
jgi:6-phosphogluconolactonase (cycloisomerase 2 family)